MTDEQRTDLAPYHAFSNGTLFCRVCLVTFLPETPTPRSPYGAGMHEAANAFRHREYQRKTEHGEPFHDYRARLG